MVDAFELRFQLGGQQQAWVRIILGEYLARGVPQRLVPGPDQLAPPDVQARFGLVGAQAVVQGVVLLARLGQGFFQAQACAGQVAFGRQVGDEFIDGLAQGAVPILVETVAELLGHRAHAEHVDVGEIKVGFGVEIFVAQVAPADDGRAVVRQPQFVVHASMLQRQVEQAPHGARHAGAAPQVQRVEQANLDVGMGGEGGDDLIEAVAGGVVQQDTHTHATVGGLEQFIHEQAGADAVVDDVVLQVEAGLGVADQFGAGHERLAAVGQQAKAGAALMRRGLGLDRTAERRLRRRQGIAGDARHIHRGAAAQGQGAQQEKR